MEVSLDPDVRDVLQTYPRQERKEIGKLIEAVRNSFGNPHAHSGIGIRALGQGIYECRHGLSLRLLFSATDGVLYFQKIGTHDEVRRFLKAR